MHFEAGPLFVVLECAETHIDLPAFTSPRAGIKCLCHHAWPLTIFLMTGDIY